MTDYSKPETVSLDALKNRIESTDLVPSRAALLDNIDEVFDRISKQDIHTWKDLQKSIKYPKQLAPFAKETGIDFQYLVLLRREIESYSPKPVNLKDIDWEPQVVIARLADHGITNSEQLISKGNNLDGFKILADQTGIDLEMIKNLGRLVRLCRVQWVSLTFARLLIEAGYIDCRQLASAEAAILCADVDRVNKEKGYFKGKIGLRDIKRLIHAAGYAL